MQTPFQVDGGEAVDAFSLPAIFEVQVDVRCPLGVVFLVDGHVAAVASDKRFGGAFYLNPSICRNDSVFAELRVVHHDVHLVFAIAAVHRDFNQEVMVAVADEGDFYVFTFQFLRDFVLAVDGVFEKSAALDFPTVVDAAASG